MQGNIASIRAKNRIFRPRLFKRETAQKKVCKECQVEQYLETGFHRLSRNADGYSNYCKFCIKTKRSKTPEKTARNENLRSHVA